jgi:FAD/FMN-containing dehydrogenase
MAELVDALRSGRSEIILVEVQVLFRPPHNSSSVLLLNLWNRKRYGELNLDVGKVAQYLQEHLLGEVTDSTEARKAFSEDASILRVVPSIIVYPRDENDVRKTMRFSWQLAERGRGLPITARGGGSDTSGAAIGSGILLLFTAHMNRVLELDQKKQFVIVEPGVTYDKLEQTLHTHGLFLPPYPASKHYATIGGGMANNAIGEKSVKYGATSAYVERMRVVLANGELIETSPLSKRELSKKMGLSSLEGEIYRTLDAMFEENAALIEQASKHLKAARNSAGYNIFKVKTKKGFDLTPLFLGSQGSLGIITEATLAAETYTPLTKLAVVSLNDLNDLNDVLPKILKLKPSMCDMINRSVVEQVTRLNPKQLGGLLKLPRAAIHLFVEFDDAKEANQKKQIKQLKKILQKVDGAFDLAQKPEEHTRLRKIRESVTTILTSPKGQSKAVPVAEDICVPVSNLVEFLHTATEIYASMGLVAPAWGHAGDGIVRMQPMLDLAQVGDRQKLTKLSDAIYKAAIGMDGSITASAGDGRVRASYTRAMYGPEIHNLMLQVKKAFDPFNILNPGVKTASQEDVKALMRGDYSLAHRHEFLPRS